MATQHKLELGDVYQMDRTTVIVCKIGERAVLSRDMANPTKVVPLPVSVPRFLVIAKRGEEGLKNFLAQVLPVKVEPSTTNPETESEQNVKGMIRLELGDQFKINGAEHTVVEVTDRRALLETDDGVQRWEKRQVQETVFAANGTIYRPDESVRKKHLEKFLANRKPSGASEQPNNGEQETKMKSKAKSKPNNKSAKTSKTKQPVSEQSGSGDNNGRLFGHSVPSALRAAGKAGATLEQAQKVVAKYNIKVRCDNTIERNLKFGRTGKLDVAPLTKEQLAEFGV